MLSLNLLTCNNSYRHTEFTGCLRCTYSGYPDFRECPLRGGVGRSPQVTSDRSIPKVTWGNGCQPAGLVAFVLVYGLHSVARGSRIQRAKLL